MLTTSTRPGFDLGIALRISSTSGTATELVDEAIAEITAAEDAGFDLCMVSEHHQGPPTSMVAPLTFLAAAAQATTRITLATGVLIVAAHHPVHVAEQVVLLDHLSKGRIVLGVGAGYQNDDFAPFGVPINERKTRLAESLTAIDILLTRDAATFDGDHYSFTDVHLGPRPFHSPRPPIWLGAWSPSGIRIAATLADGWIADPIRSDSEIAAMADRYRSHCADQRRTPHVVVMREAWVDVDDETAERRFFPVVEPIYRYYQRKGAFQADADAPPLRLRDLRDRIVCGGPDTCTDRVNEIARTTKADAIVLFLRHANGPSHHEALASIAQLGASLKGRSTARRRDVRFTVPLTAPSGW